MNITVFSNANISDKSNIILHFVLSGLMENNWIIKSILL